MTDKINRKEVLAQQSRNKGPRGKRQSSTDWHEADAARFLFKAQCYDAGPDSQTRCGLCGECIRLCYVLKVLESADPFATEAGKVVIGECCFQPIKVVNQKLYRQLLAAAINLRTFIEAIRRDQRIFGGSGCEPNEVGCPPLPVAANQEQVSEIFERLLAEGGNHA